MASARLGLLSHDSALDAAADGSVSAPSLLGPFLPPALRFVPPLAVSADALAAAALFCCRRIRVPAGWLASRSGDPIGWELCIQNFGETDHPRNYYFLHCAAENTHPKRPFTRPPAPPRDGNSMPTPEWAAPPDAVALAAEISEQPAHLATTRRRRMQPPFRGLVSVRTAAAPRLPDPRAEPTRPSARRRCLMGRMLIAMGAYRGVSGASC